MPLIAVEEVKKDYALGRTKIHALRGVSFSVEEGEFLSVIGPSGCGKTTLLNIIGCIDRATEGRVLFEGTDVAGLSDNAEAELRLRKIGFIFQSFNLIPVLNTVENVELPLVLERVPRKERRRRAEELAEMVGLSEYRRHKPDELSGGQRQRVAIARALIGHPRLVIADEPTANLDSETGDEILGVMKGMNERDGVTFLFSTHNPDVMKHANRIVRLKDGCVQSIETRS